MRTTTTLVTSSPLARRRSRFAALALGLAATLVASRASLAAGVLDHVPSSAMVVVKVSNLAATSGKIAKLAQDLGLDQLQPKLADPLGSLKEELHLQQGLDDAGELAFVFLDPQKQGNGGDPDQAMMLLIPTKDFAALTSQLTDAKPDGKVTSFKNPRGEEMFISDWGNGYAAMAQNRTLVETAATDVIKPSARATKELSNNDIILFANIPAIRDPATKQIEANREQQKEDFLRGFRQSRARGAGRRGANADANANANDDGASGIAGAAFDQTINAALAFLRDSEAATVGLSLTDGGVRYNVVSDFKEGSYIGGLTSQLKGNEQPLVSGLPTTQYLAFGGIANNPQVTNKLIDDVVGPIIKAMPAAAGDANAAAGAANTEIDAATVTKFVDGLKTYSSNVDRWNFGMVTPQGAIGQEGIFQIIGGAHGKADAILKSLQDFNDQNVALTNKLMAGQQGVTMEQKWNKDAKKVGDVSFDSISTTIVGDSQAANMMRQQMQFAYGKPDPEALVGKVSDTDVVTFIGVNDDLVTQAITATRSNEAPLMALDHVKSVSSQLPGKRVVEVYVAVDEIFTTGLRAANQMGFFQGNVQLPPDLPPVGFTVSADGPSLEASTFISSDLMQALVSAGIQLSQRRQNGGRGL